MNQEFSQTYDCDFFENRRTAPIQLRIKRKAKLNNDKLNAKLDLILDALHLSAPQIDPSGTYSVYYKDTEVFWGSYQDAVSYINKCRSGFSSPLRLVKLAIKLRR